MPIAWKALPVSRMLESLEQALDELAPRFSELKAQVEEARQAPNLPQYLTQRLDWLGEELRLAIPRLKSRILSARNAIPEEALRAELHREQNQPALEF